MPILYNISIFIYFDNIYIYKLCILLLIFLINSIILSGREFVILYIMTFLGFQLSKIVSVNLGII